MTDGVYTIGEIKERLHDVFSQLNLSKAILFGSYVRGEATEKSDIDLYIDSNGTLTGLNFFGASELIEAALQKPVDVIEKIDLDSASELAKEIANYGVLIYE